MIYIWFIELREKFSSQKYKRRRAHHYHINNVTLVNAQRETNNGNLDSSRTGLRSMGKIRFLRFICIRKSCDLCTLLLVCWTTIHCTSPKPLLPSVKTFDFQCSS